MTISVERWNGNDVQTAVYQALLEQASVPFQRAGQQIQVQPPGSWARHIRVNAQPRTLTVLVEVISGDLNTAQRQLSEWFAPGTQGELEIIEDGVAKVLDAVALGFRRYSRSGTTFEATLSAPDPRWRGVAPISAARLVSASGQSFIANNPGNSPADDVVIAIRPTAAKAAASGYLYKLESIIAWRAERPSGNYAVELTEGWDHATEVGAGRSQADGDDVRVLVDGVEVPRWFGENAATDANSAATRVWANLNFGPARTAKLLSAITAILPGEAGEIEVEQGGTLGWPRSGALLLDDEVITYSGRTERNASGNAAFTGIERARRNTTAAAHSAAATMYWLEHRVQIVYGNTGASAPAARADLKPLLDLTSSTLTNERHEWLNFADDTYPGRSMQWGRKNRTNDDQFDKILAAGGSPAASMSWEYQSGGAVSGKPNFNTWYREIPTGTGGSGGNVASWTRALADTLGLDVIGVDDDGREISLARYNGALASGSANVTQPTNPVYRMECQGYNQVVARRPDGTYSATVTPTGSATRNGQQIVCGDQPLEVFAADLQIVDSVGSNQLECLLSPDTGANVPTGAGIAFTAYTTTAAGAQTATFPTGTAFALVPGRTYWLSWYDVGTPDETLAVGYVPYKYGRVDDVSSPARTYNFRVMGRPSALATAFERCDESSYADNGDQVTIDGVTIHLATAGVPYVALKSRQAAYRFVGASLFNETTGQEVRLGAACGLGDELRIDTGAGVAVNLDDELGASIAATVEYSDRAGKLTLAPGDNSLRFVEAGLAGVNVLVESSPRWE